MITTCSCYDTQKKNNNNNNNNTRSPRRWPKRASRGIRIQSWYTVCVISVGIDAVAPPGTDTVGADAPILGVLQTEENYDARYSDTTVKCRGEYV